MFVHAFLHAELKAYWRAKLSISISVVFVIKATPTMPNEQQATAHMMELRRKLHHHLDEEDGWAESDYANYIITWTHTHTHSLSRSEELSLVPEETIFVAKESTTPLVSPGDTM